MNGKHPERFNDMSIEEYAMRRERKLAQTAAERAAEEYDKKAKGEEGKTEPQKTETNTDRLRNILNS